MAGQIGMKANVHITHIRNGEIIKEVETSNFISYAGYAGIAGIIVPDVNDNKFSYIALGIGTGQEQSDTTLSSEIIDGGGERILGTGSRITTTQTNDTAKLSATFTFTDEFTVTETGVFDTASAGNMLCYIDDESFNVKAEDVLIYDWKIQMTS